MDMSGFKLLEPGTGIKVPHTLVFIGSGRTGRSQHHKLRLTPLEEAMEHLDGVGPDEINVTSLLDRIRSAAGEVKEVVVATNSSVEGEATAVYLEGVIRPLGPKVTRLARGLPVGSELEYVDGSTIVEALAGRREM